ncbi:putative glycosyl hydrolase family 79 C-terminal beta domain [Lyophyllum shimeji]|uniref:Glycosyl hydrolase family 79 C-terminal beta domain n=1 Tax=Lyophyllum shimeji TaxID=47721 RepID=A0A9P3URM5_LYOSH|nr:putative glycosyl hydrolase family 79 C-terminal beta domain [Lyophyllum shimeji]
MLLSSLLCLAFLSTARAVTVYGQTPFGLTSALRTLTATSEGAVPTATEKPLAAYDETILKPPPLPQDQSLTFTLNLAATNASVPNLSIMQHGSFFGFSIEMSVLTQIMGKNASHIQVPFLNLMGQIQQRAGGVHIRMGGNTQDFAYWVENIPNGHATSKEKSDPKNPTLTPAVLYSDELFYLAANISSLVNVRWYLGIPFNDTNWRLTIAEKGQAILGDHLIGLQAGNEPDYYLGHGHRTEPYGPNEYSNEFAALIKAVEDNPRIPIKNMLIGPSLATGPWTPEMLFDTGYLDRFKDSLCMVTMEHYPSNNCFVQFNVGSYVDPQETFPSFLNHNAALNLVQPYRHSSDLARGIGKPFVMFETNSATCGGLPGISDSFGAGLWALDYGLTMAAANFSGALLHVGGQNVYYNPFTAPPTNQSSFHQWTVGAVYYSVIIVAEIFGKSNVSQVVDTSNNGIYAPSYAIYDNGQLSKVALFNFMDDPSGAHDITGTITVDGGQVPQQVWVKYFLASSVSVKTNLTWAGQTYGNKFQVDGRPKGELNITTIPCDTAQNQCRVPLKAPSFALVFLTDPTVPAAAEPTATLTFATTAVTKLVNTATVDPSVLATSNGHSGKERAALGSTSPGSISAARRVVPGVGVVLVSMVLGAGVVLAAVAR